MAICGICNIETPGLEEGKVCLDCTGSIRPSDKGRDFVRWLKEKHPEVVERAMMNNVSDEESTQ